MLTISPAQELHNVNDYRMLAMIAQTVVHSW